MSDKSICAIVGQPCPRTCDPTAPVYCPNWKNAIPEHEKDGSGIVRPLDIYTGCQLPKLIPYMQAMTVEADHGHAAANQARDAAVKAQLAAEGAQHEAEDAKVVALDLGRRLLLVDENMRGAVLAPLLKALGMGVQTVTETQPKLLDGFSPALPE